jgi:hypothetical protein
VRARRAALGALLVGVTLAVSGCATESAAAPAPTFASLDAPATPAPAGEQPAVLAPSRPVRVQIPSIGVDSELVDLGLQDDGTLEVPSTPGERGPAVIAGHVDWAGSPGVFADLRDVAVGDQISVLREDGSTAVFRVGEVGRYPKDAFPTAAVYGDLDHAALRVITCGGDFDRAARSYVDNTVVFADLVPTG